MKQINCSILSAVDTASQTGTAVDAGQLVSMSAHAFFGDATAAGTVKLQASNDPDAQGPISGFSPTNWVDIPSATAAVTSGGPVIITIANMSYRWIRAVYTSTSGGSTTINVNMFAIST
jgi:Flp pilus assembly protein TadG